MKKIVNVGVSRLTKEKFFSPRNISQRSAVIRLTIKPSFFYKLMRLFFKNGRILSMSKLFLSVMSKIYSYLDKPSSFPKDLQEGYLNTNEFTFVLENSKQMYNVSAILDWVISLNSSQFELRLQRLPKKYKKKSKKKYNYKIQYLQKTKKSINTLRWVYLTSYNFNTHSIERRLFLNMLDLLLNFKRSLLFLKKVSLYKSFLKL